MYWGAIAVTYEDPTNSAHGDRIRRYLAAIRHRALPGPNSPVGSSRISRCLWDDLLAIGIVRHQRQFFQQQGHIGIRNCEAGRIDRSGERRILEPPPKPSSQRKRVEPQRRLQERLEKPLALRGVEPRPAFQRRLKQISAPQSREPISDNGGGGRRVT